MSSVIPLRADSYTANRAGKSVSANAACLPLNYVSARSERCDGEDRDVLELDRVAPMSAVIMVLD